MKRFFTFLMAILALLSISQVVKAADCYIMGSFNTTAAWTKLDGQNMTALSGEKYTQEYKCTTSGEYRFRFAVGGESWQLYPHTPKYNLTEAIPNYCCAYTTDNGKGDNYFYVNMESGKTYTFTFDNSNASNRNVACTVSGSTSPSEFEKLYLIGGLYGVWKDDTTRPFTTTDGKTYKYVFDADDTNDFSKESDDYYFRVKTATSKYYRPQNNDAPVETRFTSAYEGNYNAWKFTMTKGKSYTLIFDYENKQIKYSEGGSEVVTKEIKLFNGSSVLTGSNGKYTLDLSSATADAQITLSIDDESYGLATAQTISAAGTTNVDFVANATAPLTLTKGFIYSLSVTEDGKMTVDAKEKGAANGNYYLVGNFFTEDGDKINLDKKYFRFINNKGDGTLTFDIPASLSIKAQVYGADGKCYGPVNGESFISNTNPSATEVPVNGDLVAGDNYWTFTDRGLAQTGIYTITITVDPAGTPTKWEVKYDNSKRMAYFLVDPTKDPNAVVHPAYAVVKEDRSCSNNFFGNIYLEAGKHCFVVGNITKNNDNSKPGNPLTTTPKLYLQGNGGLDPTKTVPDSERDKYTKVYPNRTPGFTYNETKSMVLEYNPSKGHDNVVTELGNHGIGGEILKASAQITDNDNPITSVQIVGNGVVGSWKLEDAKNMTYNKKLDCWEYTFTTDKSESADNTFRFIANKSWEYNWGEESTDPNDQARTPYTDTTRKGHEASLNDPNELGFTKNGTAENRNGAGTYGDMIFNRPAGEWTIRLYIRTLETEEGNNYVARYAYTITGREHTGIPLTYRAGKFIRTYSNDVAMDIIDPNVKVYEAYKYTMPDQVDNIYSQGTLELRQLEYIPANMGVVLIGTVPDTEGKYKDSDKLNFSISKRTEKSAEKDEEYVDVWTKAADYKDQPWNNFLVPTVEANNNLGNADVDDKGIAHRYFGLGNFHRTKYYSETHTGDDYIGFFRFTEDGVSGANKAYLSLPARKDVKGANFGCITYNGQLIGTGYTALAKMMLVFDDETSGVTEIKNVEVNKQNNDNAYYTLQGIKVLKPTKGIFIHNGKKVVIK